MNVKIARRYIAVFLVLLIAGSLLALRMAPAGAVKRQLAAIRAAGLPESGDELNDWYKQVPEKENRALLLLGAAKELVKTPGEFEAKWKDESSPEYIAAVTKYLETNKEVLAKLYHGPELPGSRFPVDFSPLFATLLPHLAQVKSLVILLKLEAARQVREQNAEAACRAVESGFAAASTMRVEPLIISQLVAIACESIMLNSLTNVLSLVTLKDEQLARLSTIVAQHELDGLDGFFRGLVGERAIGISAFHANYTYQQLQQLSAANSSPGSAEEWVQALGYQAYIASGLREEDFLCYLEMMARFIDATRTGFPEALERNEQTSLALQQRFSTGLGRLAILSRMMLPSLEKGLNKQAMITARLRCAEVALAIERYRLGHDGALPAKTDDLVPKYLHKLPRDPFNAEPLVFERLPEKGYEIVSGGAPTNTNHTNRTKGTNNADVAFTVLR